MRPSRSFQLTSSSTHGWSEEPPVPRQNLQDVLIKTSKGNKSDLRSDKRCHKLWVTPGVSCWSGQDADNVCLWRTQVVVTCKGMATTHQELVWHSSVVETCVLSSRKPPHTEVLRVPFFTWVKAQTLPGTTAPHWHQFAFPSTANELCSTIQTLKKRRQPLSVSSKTIPETIERREISFHCRSWLTQDQHPWARPL